MRYGFSNITINFLNAHYLKCCHVWNICPHPIDKPKLEYDSRGKLTYGINNFKIYLSTKELRNYRKVIRLNHKLIKLMLSKAEPFPEIKWGE